MGKSVSPSPDSNVKQFPSRVATRSQVSNADKFQLKCALMFLQMSVNLFQEQLRPRVVEEFQDSKVSLFPRLNAQLFPPRNVLKSQFLNVTLCLRSNVLRYHKRNARVYQPKNVPKFLAQSVGMAKENNKDKTVIYLFIYLKDWNNKL